MTPHVCLGADLCVQCRDLKPICPYCGGPDVDDRCIDPDCESNRSQHLPRTFARKYSA